MAVNIAGMLCLHAYRIDDERIGNIDVTRVVLKCVYVVYIFMRIGIAFVIAMIHCIVIYIILHHTVIVYILRINSRR